MKPYIPLLQSAIVAALMAAAPLAPAALHDGDVQARIELLKAGVHKAPSHDAGNVVLWLTPESAAPRTSVDAESVAGHFRMEQKNKSFAPHLLVVPLGSTVEFPNLDPFFHNVFSQFNGKRFDLGLYEAGSSKVVHFDHEGVSYIFCNIHSEMAAVIVTLRTPYFAVSTKTGVTEFHNVPAGDYEMHIWAEGADARELEALSRRVHVGISQRDLGTIQVNVTGVLATHKNKFGEDYMPDSVQSY